MGCGIHCFAEIKRNGKWGKVGKIFKNRYYSEDRESKIDDDGFEWNPEFTSQPYNGRNYDLFAILADVRNGYGFAGIDTGEGFIPIAEPKGLPYDVSKEIKDESDSWSVDGHSHSWFTVKELKDYNWDQTTKKKGVISLAEYSDIKRNSIIPNTYSGSIMGSNIETVDTSVADKILNGEIIDSLVDKRIFVRYIWETAYREQVSLFLDDTLPVLESLGDPEDVRIVFWFDN